MLCTVYIDDREGKKGENISSLRAQYIENICESLTEKWMVRIFILYYWRTKQANDHIRNLAPA